MFYDRFIELCEAQGVKPKTAVLEMELSNSIATAWKNRGLTPKSETLAKIAQYFEVPMDFFLERPPFDKWTIINDDRKHFINFVDADFETIDLVWGIDRDNVDSAPLKDFIQFLGDVVEYAQPTEDGGWLVSVRPTYQKKEKAPTPKGERKPDVEDLKIALFGGDGEVTDEMWEEALFAAEMIKARYKRKKAQDE